jgi:hypothetical protein
MPSRTQRPLAPRHTRFEYTPTSRDLVHFVPMDYTLPSPTATNYNSGYNNTCAPTQVLADAPEMRPYYLPSNLNDSLQASERNQESSRTEVSTEFHYPDVQLNGLPMMPLASSSGLSHRSDDTTGRTSSRSVYSPPINGKLNNETTRQVLEMPERVHSFCSSHFVPLSDFLPLCPPYRIQPAYESIPVETYQHPQIDYNIVQARYGDPSAGDSMLLHWSQNDYIHDETQNGYNIPHSIGMASAWDVRDHSTIPDSMEHPPTRDAPSYACEGTDSGYTYSKRTRGDTERAVNEQPATAGELQIFSNNRRTIPMQSSRRSRDDQILLDGKQNGLTYKQIRKAIGAKVAESTLRGRYRALTKEKRDRVRRPVWTENDVWN